MKGQLRQEEGMEKTSITVVNSIGSSRKVTGEILCHGRVLDRSRTWIIQSESHKTVTETGNQARGPRVSTQGDLNSPANVIVIRRDRVTLGSTLENGIKL